MGNGLVPFLIGYSKSRTKGSKSITIKEER